MKYLNKMKNLGKLKLRNESR